MLLDVLVKLSSRPVTLCLCLRHICHALIRLQRKLGIHRDIAGGLGQTQQTVDTSAVAHRLLQREVFLRQQVLDQRGELHLTIGPA